MKSFLEIRANLFDIAYLDAMGQMKNEENKNFLILQHQKGWLGSLVGVDLKIKHKEERALKHTAMEAARKKWNNILLIVSLLHQKLIIQHQAVKAVIVVVIMKIHVSSFWKISATATVPATWGTLQFFTPCLAKVFDRCKITDRNVAYILMAAAKAFGSDTDNLVINCTSFKCLRKISREAKRKLSTNLP